MEPRRLIDSTDVSEELRAAVRGLPKSESLSMITQQRMRNRLAAGIVTVGGVTAASVWYKAMAAVTLLAVVTGGAIMFRKHATHAPVLPARAVVSGPAAPPVLAPQGPRVEAAIDPVAPAKPTRRSHRAQPAPAAVALPETQDLAAETALLVRAQKRLASSPAEALTAADEHKGRFPNGALAAERELLAAQAWMALKQPEQARSRLRSLLAGRSGAIYAKRAQRLLDGP
ncbi:MAG: hypothetical protein SF187_01620 [Deltaproteobacteria bacterium]|nr:hypothetical protein [Deltaproteobacteria bacterium]